MRSKIFILDDDEMFARLLAANLGRVGEFAIRTFEEFDVLSRAIDETLPDAVLTDMVMPDVTGVQVTERLRRRFPHMPIFVLTAHSGIGDAVAALKAGADEYLTKPVDVDDLAALLRQALRDRARLEHYDALQEEERQRFSTSAILGEHPRVQQTRRFIEQVASVPGATVLLLGESGTGKNLAARALHAAGERSEGRLVELNCSAVPDALLEAELFGYVKGAFTGADTAKRGLVEVAHGGVLFLDELGDMPVEVQSKLLGFLESRTFRRLGSTEETEVDVQVVAATNKDLDVEVSEKRFRADLYYRIKVATHEMPPLREIVSDLPLLTHHFLRHYAGEFRRDVERVDPAAMDRLQAWRWPGNVRELRNVVERAVIFAQDATLRVDDLPPLDGPAREGNGSSRTLDEDTFGIPAGLTLAEAEKSYIAQTLERMEGDIQRSAEQLGISRKNLWERRKRHGLME